MHDILFADYTESEREFIKLMETPIAELKKLYPDLDDLMKHANNLRRQCRPELIGAMNAANSYNEWYGYMD